MDGTEFNRRIVSGNDKLSSFINFIIFIQDSLYISPLESSLFKHFCHPVLPDFGIRKTILPQIG